MPPYSLLLFPLTFPTGSTKPRRPRTITTTNEKGPCHDGAVSVRLRWPSELTMYTNTAFTMRGTTRGRSYWIGEGVWTTCHLFFRFYSYPLFWPLRALLFWAPRHQLRQLVRGQTITVAVGRGYTSVCILIITPVWRHFLELGKGRIVDWRWSQPVSSISSFPCLLSGSRDVDGPAVVSVSPTSRVPRIRAARAINTEHVQQHRRFSPGAIIVHEVCEEPQELLLCSTRLHPIDAPGDCRRERSLIRTTPPDNTARQHRPPTYTNTPPPP